MDGLWFFVIIVSYPVCCNAPMTGAAKTLSLRACGDSSSDVCGSSLLRDLLDISKAGKLSASPLLSLRSGSLRYASITPSRSTIDSSWHGYWLDVLRWPLRSPIDSSGLWYWLDVLGWPLRSHIDSSWLWYWLDVLCWLDMLISCWDTGTGTSVV